MAWLIQLRQPRPYRSLRSRSRYLHSTDQSLSSTFQQRGWHPRRWPGWFQGLSENLDEVDSLKVYRRTLRSSPWRGGRHTGDRRSESRTVLLHPRITCYTEDNVVRLPYGTGTPSLFNWITALNYSCIYFECIQNASQFQLSNVCAVNEHQADSALFPYPFPSLNLDKLSLTLAY